MKQAFDKYVCVGDSITWCVDGFDITATIHEDTDSSPDDADCYMQEHKDSWRADHWFFCGVVLSVARNGITLDKHAASLWAVEANFPDAADNSYLGEVAQELESEALEAGRAALKQVTA